MVERFNVASVSLFKCACCHAYVVFISKMVGGVLLEGSPKGLFWSEILSPFRKMSFPSHAF